jgi:hypothetical protein
MPITGGVSPRIRIFLLTLLTALVIAPAQASATTSACGNDLGPYALANQDQTVVPDTNWQVGSPAGSVDIPLQGSNVDAFEYKVNCGNATVVNGTSGTATVTGQGIIRFTHRARDSVSGTAWTDWVDEFVRIDSGDPVNTTPVISSNWRRGPAIFPVTATDATSPSHAEWRVDGGSWNLTGTATVVGTGPHTVDTAAVDSAGNRKEITYTVNIDDVVPTDTTDTAPVGWQPQAVDLTVDGTDADAGVDHVEWQIDSNPPGSGPDGTIVSINTQGQHTFRTRVVDEVGNVSTWRSQPVWVNIAGPIDETAVPTTWYTTPTVDVDVTGTDELNRDLARIQWRLDGQPGGDVSNPVNSTVPVTIAGDGVHQLEVRLTDVDNRVLDWHTHLVKIDTVTPIDLTTIATGWLPYSSLNVNVRGTDTYSDIQSVEWRIDGGNVGSATSDRHDVTVSGDGVHTLETRVIDNAGLASAWVPRTIKLDATAPTNLTPVAPTGWRNTPYSVVLDGADALSGVASVSWKIQLQGMAESGENVGSAGHETATVNQDGTHLLSTRVRDIGGTVSTWRTEVIQIDRVLPTDNTAYPSAPVSNRHVVNFNPADDRSGVAAVEWKLDGGVTKTNSSVTITGEGVHQLEVRVRDNAGNYSGWATHTITVTLPPDSTAPDDNTNIPAQWRTSAYTVTVAAADDIDGVGVDYVEWRLDDDEIQSGPAGSTFTVTADGQHIVDTRVWDKAGNHTDWKTQTLSIDKTRPTDASTIASGWVNSRTITFAGADATSGMDRITYDVSGPSPTTGTITGTTGGITLASDGVYTISYSIYDVAGQRLNRSVTYKADTVNPVNTSAAAPTAWQTPSLSLALTGTDAASGIDHGEWRVNGGSAQSGSTAVVTSEGTQSFETRVVDKAGNASPWRPETIKVDHTAPANTTAQPTSTWRNSDYTRTITGVDAASGVQRVEYSVDGGATQLSGNVTISGEGVHTLASRIVDNAGNLSGWRTDTIGIDRTVPALSADCGTTAWRNTQPTCSVAATGGLSGLAGVTADGHPVVDGAYAVQAQGAATIHFRAVDGAGNESVATAEVKVDTSAPAPAVNCVADSGTAWTCTATASDAVSGVAGMAYSVDGTAPAPINNGDSFSVATGSLTVYATDNAGNGAAAKAVTLADRSTPPAPPTPRTKSAAVFLRKGGAAAARLVGQLSIDSLPSSTTVDLRPLAIGKGSFQFVFTITAAGKTKTVTKTQKIKTGYSTRISIVLPASAKTSVSLTVKRKTGKRWLAYATGAAKL